MQGLLAEAPLSVTQIVSEKKEETQAEINFRGKTEHEMGFLPSLHTLVLCVRLVKSIRKKNRVGLGVIVKSAAVGCKSLLGGGGEGDYCGY